MKIEHQISDLYQKWFPRELLKFELTETKATCSQCAMAPGRTRTKATYQPDLKCCTFEPFVPNFLVGALLSQPKLHPAGVGLLKNKIKNREFSLPIGMTASLKYQIEFNARKPEDFGNREDWLCSYYDRETELCQIWRYRGAVCSTFFCKSVYGKKGLNFWARFNDYMTYVEMALMEEALVYLDFSPRQVSNLLDFLNRKQGQGWEIQQTEIPLDVSKKLWNGYFDEQEEFFQKSYRLVTNFDKKHFREAIGEIGAGIEDRLLESLDVLKTEKSALS